MKIKDLVTRHSHSHDIVFQIIGESEGVYHLKGVDYRLYADASKEDLRLYDNQNVKVQLPRLNIPPNVASGKVLHIDGDETYVKKAKEAYAKYHIPAACYHIIEKEIPGAIIPLLNQDKYDVLVITGHDFYQINKPNEHDLTSYQNSINFVSAVQQARRVYPDLDSLVIIAGACQSNYEALISSGANFASSPTRDNIHMLDPIIVASIIASSSVKDYVSPHEVIDKTITKAMGGIETKGKARLHYAGDYRYEHINQSVR